MTKKFKRSDDIQPMLRAMTIGVYVACALALTVAVLTALSMVQA